VVERQAEILRRGGHEVELIGRSSDDLVTQALPQFRAGWRVVSGGGHDPLRELNAFRPDVVHVHNLFPNFGTKWLKNAPAPVVATIHNFRAVCANGQLFRNNTVCTDCIVGSSLSALKHRCYRNSYLATIPLAVTTMGGLQRNDLFEEARRLIVMNDTSAAILVSAGAAEEKLRILPHSVDPNESSGEVKTIDRWFVASRLSPEKGVLDLVKLWPAEHCLDIAGSGPESVNIEALGHPSVTMLGSLESSDLRSRLPGYLGLIFPSKWLETQGMVVMEAFAAGAPVIAYNGNPIAKLVDAEGVGERYSTGFELAAALTKVKASRDLLGERARRLYQRDYTDQMWLSRIERIYEDVLSV